MSHHTVVPELNERSGEWPAFTAKDQTIKQAERGLARFDCEREARLAGFDHETLSTPGEPRKLC